MRYLNNTITFFLKSSPPISNKIIEQNVQCISYMGWYNGEPCLLMFSEIIQVSNYEKKFHRLSFGNPTSVKFIRKKQSSRCRAHQAVKRIQQDKDDSIEPACGGGGMYWMLQSSLVCRSEFCNPNMKEKSLASIWNLTSLAATITQMHSTQAVIRHR